ncbi:hypothetical protein [Pusillimonas sp. T7-7]|uniref:hypothetical protein n=1 Tax=Pusillimonas sp. (strain T7-7) TaxID=1007105 RepID=UPI0005A1BAD9|nr:hypothetical protein [Pusillimonas sp. T7-7]
MIDPLAVGFSSCLCFILFLQINGAMLNLRNWESAMWKCIYCQRDVKFKAIQLEFDNDGFYFICPDSKGRNPLENASKPGDEDTALGQRR